MAAALVCFRWRRERAGVCRRLLQCSDGPFPRFPPPLSSVFASSVTEWEEERSKSRRKSKRRTDGWIDRRCTRKNQKQQKKNTQRGENGGAREHKGKERHDGNPQKCCSLVVSFSCLASLFRARARARITNDTTTRNLRPFLFLSPLQSPSSSGPNPNHSRASPAPPRPLPRFSFFPLLYSRRVAVATTLLLSRSALVYVRMNDWTVMTPTPTACKEDKTNLLQIKKFMYKKRGLPSPPMRPHRAHPSQAHHSVH